jgi:type VI secretion system secreted protein Hcp
MAGDMFLKIDGLKGESVDEAKPTHKDEFDIISWSVGVSNPASFALGQGGQQSKPVWSDFSITKYVDKGTASLMNACASGKHFATGQITCRKAIGDSNKLEYLVIKLQDLLVTGVHHSGSGHEQYVHENVSLTCAVIDWNYQGQADADGTSAGNFEFVYDLQKQTSQAK